MKTAPQILDEITRHQGLIAERPKMYGNDAMGAEGILGCLEYLREAIIRDVDPLSRVEFSGYYKFLLNKYHDIGATTYLGRKKVDDNLDLHSEEAFRILSTDWQEYCNSDFYIPFESDG